MLFEMKRLPLWSVVKAVFFVSLIAGFIAGLLYGIIMLKFISVVISNMEFGGEIFSDISSIGGIGVFFMAVIFSLFSSVTTSVGALIAAVSYNLVAGWFGGIEIELREVTSERK